MILQEDFKNLNVIDRSLINGIEINRSDDISPDSEVVIDKVAPKERHNFNTVLDMLENDDDVGYIVFRASRRQLMIIGYMNKKDNSTNNGFYVGFSDYAYDIIDELGRYQQKQTITDRMTVKTMMSTAFLGFYADDETAKKVWDILVIKKDSKRGLRDDRTKSREGVVPLPKEKGYDTYIQQIKNELDIRLDAYIDSKRPKIQSKEDVMKLFTTEKALKKIRIDDSLYKLLTKNLTDDELIYTYQKMGTDYWNKDVDKYCIIKFGFNGIYPYVKSIEIRPETFGSEIHKSID